MNEFKGFGILLIRSGSQGLEDKNIRIFGGEPLFAKTLRAMLDDQRVVKVYISTDYHDLPLSFLPEEDLQRVVVLQRPASLAGSDVTTKEVIIYLSTQINNAEFDFCVYCQATEPLRPKGLISKCIDRFIEGGVNSVFAGVSTHKNYWIKDLAQFSRLSSEDSVELPRQIKAPIYREDTGVCCVFDLETFEKGDRVGRHAAVVEYDGPASLVDIHSALDFEVAEILYKRFHESFY